MQVKVANENHFQATWTISFGRWSDLGLGHKRGNSRRGGRNHNSSDELLLFKHPILPEKCDFTLHFQASGYDWSSQSMSAASLAKHYKEIDDAKLLARYLF